MMKKLASKKSKPTVYLNGYFLPADEAKISIADRGFLLGDGIFETMRLYSGKILFLPQHIARLKRGAELLKINFNSHLIDVKNFLDELITINDFDNKDAIIRLTVTRGTRPLGVMSTPCGEPTVLITIFPFVHTLKNELKVYLSTVRINENSPLVSIKSLCYLEKIIAREQARMAGYNEAFLINSKGHVAEATTANLFYVRDEKLFTPPLCDGALPGVTREVVMHLAGHQGITVQELSLAINDLHQIDELFVTNSVNGIIPVIQVNDMLISSSVKGSILQTLKKQYQLLIKNN